MYLSEEAIKTLDKSNRIVAKCVAHGILTENDLTQFERIVMSIKNASFKDERIDESRCRDILASNKTDDSEFTNNYEFEIREDGVVIKKFVGFDQNTIVIPDSFNGRAIIGIGAYAFSNSKKLEKIVLGKNIRFVGEYSFNDCESLTIIQLNESLRVVGEYAFQATGIRQLIIPDGVVYIGKRAFSNSKCVEVKLPSLLAMISSGLFYGCKDLVSIMMPDHVLKIEDLAFAECSNLQKMRLNDGLYAIGDQAFLNCKQLSEMDIPNSVKSFGDKVFVESYIVQPDLRYNPRTFYRNLDITIMCSAKSCALKYARDNGLSIMQSTRAYVDPSTYKEYGSEVHVLEIRSDIMTTQWGLSWGLPGFPSREQFLSLCDIVISDVLGYMSECYCLMPYEPRTKQLYQRMIMHIVFKDLTQSMYVEQLRTLKKKLSKINPTVELTVKNIISDKDIL